MACNYKCENQKRQQRYGFLLCQKLVEEDVDYNNKENALKALCAFQKFCTRTNRMENSDGAKYCKMNDK